MPSFILIRQTVWPQYTNVTDRQTDRQDRTGQTDRQRSDSIGRTVLQTFAQKLHLTHKIVYITHFKIRQILTDEDGPLKLNLLIKQQILMVKTGQFTTKCKGDKVIAVKLQISLS